MIPGVRAREALAFSVQDQLRRVVRLCGVLTVTLSVGVWTACENDSEVEKAPIAAHSGPAAPPYNLLLITLDTTRADRLGCYGYGPAGTPALDGLAESGTLFERAYTPVPITLPAHASLFTGLNPPEHGIRSNGREGLDAQIPTLAEILERAGYATGAFVASSVLSATYGLDRGFQNYDDISELAASVREQSAVRLDSDPQRDAYRMGDEVVDAALSWLRSDALEAGGSVATEASQPFFAWVHLYDPHAPNGRHRGRFGSRFDDAYDAEIAFMDLQISRLFEFLDVHGLRERTLVVVVGDHGEGLGINGEDFHGFMLYSTLHVPLLFSLGGVIPAGAKVSNTLSTVDLLPTLMDLLEIAPEVYSAGDPRSERVHEMRTRSFAGVFRDQAVRDRPIYAETRLPHIDYGWSPLAAYLDSEWKYIRAPRPELYDRRSDPQNRVDVIRSYPDEADALRAALIEMEAAMPLRVAAVVEPSEAELQGLRALGYAVESRSDRPNADPSQLPDVKDMLPVLRLEQGVRARLEEGDLGDETLRSCQELVALSPGTAVFHSWLGTLRQAHRQPDAARESFRAALSIAPDSVSLRNNLAMLLVEQGALDLAIKEFEIALRLRPDDASLQFNLGLASNRVGLSRGDPTALRRAVELFGKILESDPGLAEAHHNLGTAYLGLGRLELAVEQFRVALALQPGHDLARQGLAMARRRIEEHR